MTEHWELAVAAVTALNTIFMGLMAYLLNRREQQRKESQTLVESYSKLLDDMRAMVNLNNEEVARLRSEVNDLETALDNERKLRVKERAALQHRIDELTAINETLQQKLAVLEGKACSG
jgi:uncharacterized protein YlxW (UPF0749 family)